jgi:hypothetical protein
MQERTISELMAPGGEYEMIGRHKGESEQMNWLSIMDTSLQTVLSMV